MILIQEIVAPKRYNSGSPKVDLCVVKRRDFDFSDWMDAELRKKVFR